MIELDTLPAKDRFVATTVEMLHAIRMLITKLALHYVLFVFIKLKSAFRQLLVFLNNFIQDVDIQR